MPNLHFRPALRPSLSTVVLVQAARTVFVHQPEIQSGAIRLIEVEEHRCDANAILAGRTDRCVCAAYSDRGAGASTRLGDNGD